MTRGGKPGTRRWSELSGEERRRVSLAAARRPMHLLVLLIGLGMSLATSALWVAPLTLATYAALIFFSSGDPFFQGRVLEGRQRRGLPGADEEPSPERRARWLPRGQTREKVEAALEVQRKTISAIQESDEVTREVLSDAVPKLHSLGNGLVDLAHRREEASSEIKNLQKRATESGETSESSESPALQDGIQELQRELGRADEELSGMVERLLALRSGVVQVSLEARDPERERAGALMRDLDDLNRRVEALGETLDPPRH